jgi:hypothetical protein
MFMAIQISLVCIAFVGWLWAVAQFFLSRRHQRKDKILDRRYEAKTSAALLALNQKMCDSSKRATEPLLIIRQEVSALELVCSSVLLEKISELKALIGQYNNAMQSVLGLFNVYDMGPYQAYIRELSANPMWLRFEELNREMLGLMRKEIGG